MTSEVYLLLLLQSPFKHITDKLIVKDRINKETLMFDAEGKKADLDENSRFISHLLQFKKILF